MAATIPFGSADLLIGFELCETVRNIKRLSKNGRLIVNIQRINPVTVSLGMDEYDGTAMEEALRDVTSSLIMIDGYALAIEAGSIKAVNTVLLGASVGSGYLPISRESFMEAIRSIIPQRFHSINFTAIDSGYHMARHINEEDVELKER